MDNPFETIYKKLEEFAEKQDQFLATALNRDGLNPDEFLTMQATAEYLGLKVSTIQSYTRGRKLPHYKRGSSIYFKKSELNDYISAGRIEPKRGLSQKSNHVY